MKGSSSIYILSFTECLVQVLQSCFLSFQGLEHQPQAQQTAHKHMQRQNNDNIATVTEIKPALVFTEFQQPCFLFLRRFLSEDSYSTNEQKINRNLIQTIYAIITKTKIIETIINNATTEGRRAFDPSAFDCFRIETFPSYHWICGFAFYYDRGF